MNEQANESDPRNGAELELPADESRATDGADVPDAHLDAVIVNAEYHGDLDCMTCALTVRNGSTINGVYVRRGDALDLESTKQAALAQGRQMLRVLESYCLAEARAQQAELEKLMAKARAETRTAGDTLKATVPDLIAPVAHEVNRAYCQSWGDNSQPAWDEAPDWQRNSAIHGVRFHLDNPDATPEASHENWRTQKAKEGWRYGEVKDPENKKHPCMVPFDELPIEQRAKDYLFRAVVHSMVKPYLGRKVH